MHLPHARFVPIAALLAAGWTGSAAAAPAAPPKAAEGGTPRLVDSDVSRPPTLDAGNRREQIVNKLKNVKISLEFSDTPLPDALDFIRSATGIDFVIDAKVSEKLPDDQLKVSLKVRDIPLGSALKLLLGTKNLGAIYRDGVLLIVLKEELDKEVELRIYDVRDLLMKVQDHPGPVIELRPPGGEKGGIAGATFSLEEDKKILTEDFIVDMVKKNCGGTTWEQNPNASIALNNGLLMVVQSKRVHAEILQLIGMLRQYK